MIFTFLLAALSSALASLSSRNHHIPYSPINPYSPGSSHLATQSVIRNRIERRNKLRLYALSSHPSSRPAKIIIAGAPASGKGTQCEVIKDKFGVVHLSTGDILRAAVKEGTELGLKAKSYMDDGKLVPDELITNVICQRLNQEDCQTRGWLLDGFPRTKAQAEALTAAGMEPDAFVLLDVPEDVLVERVTGRRTDPVTGKIYHLKFSPPETEEIRARLTQRSDDTAEKIVVRYREFQSHIDSVRNSYKDSLIWVDGARAANEVSTVVVEAISSSLKIPKSKLPAPKKLPSRALNIIIAGAPASGKGTQCEVIKDKFGVVHLSTGDILRAAVKEGTELGLKAKSYMDAGQLVPDELITSVIVERVQQDDCLTKGWLLDGFPRTEGQAAALSSAGLKPDAFVLLDVPEDVLVERVTGRRTDPVTGKIYHLKFSPPETEEIRARLTQRSDDTAEKIVVRYREFQSHIDAVKHSYEKCLIRVDGTLKASDVSSMIVSSLNEIKKRKVDSDDDDGLGPGSVDSKKSTMDPSVLAMTIGGTASLIAIDKAFSTYFRANSIKFPSSLAAMIALFGSLSTLDSVGQQELSDKLSKLFQPSVAAIKAILPLLFVPPLVVLPLKMYLLAGYEAKMSALVGVGLIASVVVSGMVSEFLGKLLPSSSDDSEVVSSYPVPKIPTPSIPGALMVLSLLVNRFSTNPAIRNASLKTFGVSSSFASYFASSMLPVKLKSIFHPVLLSASLIVVALSFLGFTTGVDSNTLLMHYFGSGNGAGDFISSMLGPAIVSFGAQLFSYRGMLSRNAARIGLTTVFAAAFGLLSSAALAGLVGFPERTTALSTLTRCITTPLALSGANVVGADPSLAAFLVVITGILGASFAEKILSIFNVSDPISVGLSMGSSAHGLGTAALSYDAKKFSASVVSMTLTGVWTVILLLLAPFREILVNLAVRK